MEERPDIQPDEIEGTEPEVEGHRRPRGRKPRSGPADVVQRQDEPDVEGHRIPRHGPEVVSRKPRA